MMINVFNVQMKVVVIYVRRGTISMRLILVLNVMLLVMVVVEKELIIVINALLIIICTMEYV